MKNRSTANVESAFINWRYCLVLFFVFLSLVGLIFGAINVQILNSEELHNEADKRSVRSQALYAERGMVVDRNQKWLAVSVQMSAIAIDPKIILEQNSLEQKRSYWEAFATTLNTTYQAIVEQVNNNPKSRFIYIHRQVGHSDTNYIRDLGLPGVIIRPTFRRFYPKAEETAHIIGYTNIDGDGIEGVEKSFNQALNGHDGRRVYRKDRYGNSIEIIDNTQKRNAPDVVLSIDEHLQSMLYRRIKEALIDNNANGATAILLDIQTGEILAMANAPSFNPNNRRNLSEEALRNRAITDQFEPGSTVKPFVVLAALEQGIVNKNSVLDTRSFVVNQHQIKDVAPRNSLTLEGILQKSSNTGVSRLALQMSPNILVDTYQKAGFGQPTNLGLVGEQQGNLLANRRWSDIDRAAFSYGYGLTITPLQLVRAYATLGSFGIARPLSIKKIEGNVQGVRVYSEHYARQVVEMLESTTLPEGTATAAAVKGYRVAAKTGTSKKIENGRYVDKYIAYTAGIAPISNPRYALVVMVDEPRSGRYYGGAIAGPVFSKIMTDTLAYYHVKPDGKNEDKASIEASRVIRLTQP